MTREEATNCLADLLDAYNDDWHGDYFYDNSDAVCDAVVFFMENRPRWISVEERLPENETTVLVLAKRKHWREERRIPVISMGFYTDGKHHTEESSYAWDDLDEYIEEADAYKIPEGWWEEVNYSDEFAGIADFVTHWMPLPEPPTEEEV